MISSSFVLINRFYKIAKFEGIKGMCLYMKACQLYVMHYVSSRKKHNFIHSHTFGPAVSLTRSGIPRILPLYFRSLVASRSP